MLKIISWIGTLTSVVGSFAVANHYFLVGYVLFIVGSLSWAIIAITKNDRALLTMNGVFFIANLMGLYNAIA